MFPGETSENNRIKGYKKKSTPSSNKQTLFIKIRSSIELCNYYTTINALELIYFDSNSQ